MGERDPRIDAYIAARADFARPILERLRDLVHRGCPAVVETIKWGMPAFEHRGLLCIMAGFKTHCTFSFWRGTQVVQAAASGEAMGQFGRLRSLRDLPPERTLLAYIRKAAQLNESGRRTARAIRPARPSLPVPDDLAAAFALRRHARARAAYDRLSPSHRREYIEWITEAKRPATRARRLATALEWLAEGKPRNWQYMARPSGTAAERKARGKPRP